MKYIPIKKCGECVYVYKTFYNGVNYRTLKDCFCRHPDRPEIPLMKVDPKTIHKDCPLDDMPEFPKTGEHVCTFILDLKTGDYKLKQ